VYDITKPPSDDMVQKYDIVVCISTLEEVRADHVGAFNNLYRQLKPGGHLIITFDLPGLQLDKFEKMFGLKLSCDGTPINGSNSRLKNDKYANLNVGLMVVRNDD
jgi:SAM-dependent methyltransferase